MKNHPLLKMKQLMDINTFNMFWTSMWPHSHTSPSIT